MRKNTKIYQVLNHLKHKGKLTQRQSVELYNDYRLSAKIHVLKHDYGHNITCKMLPFTDYNGNKSMYGEYTLHPPAVNWKYDENKLQWKAIEVQRDEKFLSNE